MRTELTELIERSTDSEKRLGVSFDAVYAYQEDDCLYINGEMHRAQKTRSVDSLEINVTFHDDRGRMIARVTHVVGEDDVDDFVSFSLLTAHPEDAPSVARIKLFPRKYP